MNNKKPTAYETRLIDTREGILALSDCQDAILDIIAHADDFDQSDLQSVISAQLIKLIVRITN